MINLDLPRSKYSDSIHTPGKEFTLDGKNYVGWYFVTYQEEYYTGKIPSKDSKKIFKVLPQTPTLPADRLFISQINEPTLDDRVRGVWERYLLQNQKSKVIIEVTKERYQAFKNTPNIKKTTLEWVIKGPANDVVKGPYTYKGAENKNRETVLKLESTFPGITNYFKDYSEFVE